MSSNDNPWAVSFAPTAGSPGGAAQSTHMLSTAASVPEAEPPRPAAPATTNGAAPAEVPVEVQAEGMSNRELLIGLHVNLSTLCKGFVKSQQFQTAVWNAVNELKTRFQNDFLVVAEKWTTKVDQLHTIQMCWAVAEKAASTRFEAARRTHDDISRAVADVQCASRLVQQQVATLASRHQEAWDRLLYRLDRLDHVTAPTYTSTSDQRSVLAQDISQSCADLASAPSQPFPSSRY